jgi:hypothetical protein
MAQAMMSNCELWLVRAIGGIDVDSACLAQVSVEVFRPHCP